MAQSISTIHHCNGQSLGQLVSSVGVHLCNATRVKVWRHLQAQHCSFCIYLNCGQMSIGTKARKLGHCCSALQVTMEL